MKFKSVLLLALLCSSALRAEMSKYEDFDAHNETCLELKEEIKKVTETRFSKFVRLAPFGMTSYVVGAGAQYFLLQKKTPLKPSHLVILSSFVGLAASIAHANFCGVKVPWNYMQLSAVMGSILPLVFIAAPAMILGPLQQLQLQLQLFPNPEPAAAAAA